MISGFSGPPAVGGRDNLASVQSDIASLKTDIAEKKKQIEKATSGQYRMQLKAELDEMLKTMVALEAKRQAMAEAQQKQKDVSSEQPSKIGTKNFGTSTPFGARSMWV
ncbi:hypothetical protein [Rhizobium sp. 2MFCol3.1]|uniref:hypothetical protein n=1 Tax=Rhizobium sp. 2MFCol3.1 TaxID=1246459 RepID=UPI00036C43A8|nr:hypothetical protein [Rhizobium sp. 2MFCol3.1]